ncbi:UNVERIFIED_CONTAM: hypothetical protein O1L33_31745, partial [Pseudomonas aeruginosa]
MLRYLSLFAVGLATGYAWGWIDGLARISHRKRCTGPSDARKLLCKERFSATTESGPMQTQCNPKQ